MSASVQSLHELVRVLQIVVGAMALGIVSFTAVSLAIGPSLQPDPANATTLLSALCFLAIGELGAWLALRPLLAQRLRRALETAPPEERWARLAGHLRVSYMIPAALIEGVGLFGVVIYLVAGAPAALIAPGLAVALLALMFPTRDRIEQAIARLER